LGKDDNDDRSMMHAQEITPSPPLALKIRGNMIFCSAHESQIFRVCSKLRISDHVRAFDSDVGQFAEINVGRRNISQPIDVSVSFCEGEIKHLSLFTSMKRDSKSDGPIASPAHFPRHVGFLH
jgi:hypothetical protein